MYSDEFKKEVVDLYLSGLSLYVISKDKEVNPRTIKNWVRKSGHEIRKSKFTNKRNSKKRQSIALYQAGKEYQEIAQELGIQERTVKAYLYEAHIPRRPNKNTAKGEPTQEEKEFILEQYLDKKRGISYIAQLIGRSDYSLRYWLKKWGVKLHSRSEVSTTIREIYGPTKGFSGQQHSKDSKKKISGSLSEFWEKTSQIPVGAKATRMNTKVGVLQGSYEVAEAFRLYNDGKSVISNRSKIKTPYGTYTPDLLVDDVLIEIKSHFTLQIAQGIVPNQKRKVSDKQWKKIEWSLKNAGVKLCVLDSKNAWKWFVRAVESGFVKDQIEIKSNTFKIVKKCVL